MKFCDMLRIGAGPSGDARWRAAALCVLLGLLLLFLFLFLCQKPVVLKMR